MGRNGRGDSRTGKSSVPPVRATHHGHRKRLRERYRQADGQGFLHYELLELLLSYTRTREDTKPLAKELLGRFKTIAGVMDAGYAELTSMKGVNEATATLIRLVREFGVLYLAEGMKNRDLLSSPQAVIDFARGRLAGCPHEAFLVIFLNTKNEVIGHDIVQEGTVDRAVVYPRRVVEAALAHHAAGLVLVHNHPSGYTEPSEDDRSVTRSIAQAAEALDIRVLDHIIVARSGYLSFMEKGIMPVV